MNKKLIISVLILGLVSLFLENLLPGDPRFSLPINIIDFAIIFLSWLELAMDLRKAPYRGIYIRKNLISLLFLVSFTLLFGISKYTAFSGSGSPFAGYVGLMVFRNAFMVLKIFSRFKKLSTFLQNMAVHPAQTLVLSFLMLILLGTLLLSMPFASAAHEKTPLLDSLFTATSAVCVTGLIVVDTAVHFSFWGKIILLLLIQAGGLGIMLLSFATLFLLRRNVSLENKMFISYMINEEDMTKIQKMLRSITGMTFLIELAGALMLFIFLPPAEGGVFYRMFIALFHSVSAFCNAGFALFSDSLESVAGNPGVILTVSFLIILGSISFAVLTDLGKVLRNRLDSRKKTGRTGVLRLQTNSQVVLLYSAALILGGMFFIYIREHAGLMKDFSLGKQYLSAFFQSVTLRTAGFTSLPFGRLSRDVLLLMIMVMFIGGASGSTAGGIKVNTAAVILAYLRSLWRKERGVTLYGREVMEENVLRAFSILVLGLLLVLTGTLILSITEKADFLSLLFETVSAFATVGLSTGITGDLSSPGKVVIIVLMFTGRLGPLTLVSAAGPGRNTLVRYKLPRAGISIG